MTQSGGGGEYSLGTATLTMRGDMQPLERDLARMRAVVAEMEQRGVKIDAPNVPPPPPETKRGYEELTRTIEEMRRSIEQNGDSFHQLNQNMAAAGATAGNAAGAGGFGNAAKSLFYFSVAAAKLIPLLGELDSVQGLAVAAAAKFGLVSKSIPILGAAASAATPMLGGLGRVALSLIPGLGQLGLAAMGLNAIFGVMSAGARGAMAPLQELSSEAGRLNKQVAEAGIFAAQSFAILGPDGKLVEGAARQMQMVRGAILKEYKGIQQEVANINGATASEIYDGFNIILQNISSLGDKGTLENSAKLATRLAAGMNTLGIPGYQLRQEVNSLMMGNIGPDAMLAKKLGITNENVRQQQAQGTYYDFLMKKLEKLYEGQKVLALSLENVKSNFDDVNQAIASESGQPLERDTAQMMQTILITFKNLQGSFSGLFKSIAEAVGPIIKLFGPIVSVLTSIGAIASSVGRVIMDVLGVVTAGFGGVVLPVLTAVARTVEVIAKGFELVAELIGAVINPMKALFNVDADTATEGVNSFFDNMLKGMETVSDAIKAFNQLWSKLTLNAGLAGLRNRMQLQGASNKEIQAAENDYRERFKAQTGLTEAVELRSLQLPPNVTKYLEELDAKLGTGAARTLNISKAWAQIREKSYQNEIKALEQGVSLLTRQKELAEAINATAAARRALEARGYELGVQVAASPEAKASAEARLADLKLRQEKEAIAERRGILQTERELQQRQMLIQEKQVKIQQEQLKIQLAEAKADQVRVAEATQAAIKARGNTTYRSPEYQDLTHRLNVLAAEGTRNVARIAGTRKALRLAYEAEGQVGTMAGLQAQVLGLQEQQLNIQGQQAQYTREQERLLAQISAEEQEITNELTKATNEQNRNKQALKRQNEEINDQNTLLERRNQLEKAQADLAITRGKAEVQAAERLHELQELQDRARSGGGTASVIEAQIAAAAAEVSGMETAAEAQQRLIEARNRQMTREHELQRQQMAYQHERERSEVRIQQLRLQGQQVELTLQRAQILAEIKRLSLSQQRDAIAPQLAGSSTVPGLGAVARLPGSISGRLDASGQNGADMPVGPNNEMRSYHNGVVTEIAKAGNNGNYAVIEFFDDLGNKLEATYSHMAAMVKVGQQVVGGQVLGRFDGSGRTFGAHNSVDINSPGTNGALQRNAETAAARRSADILVTGKVQGRVVSQAPILPAPAPGWGNTGAPPAPVLPAAPTSVNPKLLKYMAAARAAGFTGEDLIKMTAVGMAESSGNPGVIRNRPDTGDLSYGAWQVNMIGDMGPQRRRQYGLANNDALLDLNTNARVAKSIFDSQGITAWGAYTDGRYRQYMGEARAAASLPTGSVASTVAAAGGTVAPSTANQAAELQERLSTNDETNLRIAKALEGLNQRLQNLDNIQALQQENLTEQQLAERAQATYEQVKATITSQVMQTPEGRLAIASGDAVSGSISGSISGALQALLTGGDVKQAVSSALAQAGQSLMQATLDALLNPLLAQLQGGIVKAVTGIDIEGKAQLAAANSLQGAAASQQAAATSQQAAATSQQGAAVQLSAAAQALMAAAAGPGAVGGASDVLGTLASKLPSLASSIGGMGGGNAFTQLATMGQVFDFGTAMSMPSLTAGRAGGGEIEYGLPYLVGEKNAEIVRFNQAGGRVFSNRALTKALGVPFQRTPGGGTAVADGDATSRAMPPIPFLKPLAGRSAGAGPMAGRDAGAGPSGSTRMATSRALRVKVDTQVINGIEYATVEQLRQAAAAAAAAGRDLVYSDLRNNPSIQRSVGLG